MSANIKAIPTPYRGVTFRSRTEARWAVFFDSLGAGWNYEREGFDLGGAWYLPDFYIPEWETWFEVKPEEAGNEASKKCRLLAKQTKKKVLMALGPPPLASFGNSRQNIAVFLPREGSPEEGDPSEFFPCMILEGRRNERELWVCDAEDFNFLEPLWLPEEGANTERFPIVGRRVTAAYAAAVNERFGVHT